MPVSWKNNIYSGDGVVWDTEEYSGDGFCDDYEGGDYDGGDYDGGDYDGGDYDGGDFDGGMYYDGEGKRGKRRRAVARKTTAKTRMTPSQMGKDLAIMQSLQKTMSAQAQKMKSRVIPNLRTKSSTKKPKKKNFLTCMLPIFRKLPEATRGSFATFLKNASTAQKKSCVGRKVVPVARKNNNPFLNCMSGKYSKRDDKKVMWRSFLHSKKSLCAGKPGLSKRKPMTVVQLKNWARGKIVGFSTLKKAELQKLYNKHHPKK